MKLTRRQLSRLIKENLSITEATVTYGSAIIGRRKLDGSDAKEFKFTETHSSTNGKDITEYKVTNFKASYMGSKDLVKPDNLEFKPDFKNGKVNVSFSLPGKLYGKNDFNLSIKLSKLSYKKQLAFKSEGVYVEYNIEAAKTGKRMDDDMQKQVKLFEPKTPWGQSSAESDDSRFFQFFMLAIYFGENSISQNGLNDPKIVKKYLGSDLSRYPNGFDGKLGPVTKKSWVNFVNKYRSQFEDKMMSTFKENSPSSTFKPEDLKDIRKIGKLMNIGLLAYTLDSELQYGISGIAGFDMRKLIKKATKAGIKIPLQWANGGYNPSYDNIST